MTETYDAYLKRVADRDEEDFRSLLKSAWGRRFVWNFMAKCGIFTQSFVSGDPQATAFNEGRRAIGNTLLRQVIEINPEAYLQMVKSQKKEEEYARTCEQSRPELDTEPE